MTHQPAISVLISFLSPFNRAGGRTFNVRKKKTMAIHIKIRYPELSDIVTEQDISTLKIFEDIIAKSMLTVMGSTSNYRWEHASQYDSDRFYSLVKTYDSAVVGTFGIQALKVLPPEDLIERIKMERLFPPKQ